jgi:hypothetical protein
VPQILHTDSVDAPPSADEEFLELLCADQALLRAEFDAIIAAEWPNPPPADPDHGAGASRRPNRPRQRRETSVAGLRNQPRHPGIGRWTRQRSPPARGSHNRRQ